MLLYTLGGIYIPPKAYYGLVHAHVAENQKNKGECIVSWVCICTKHAREISRARELKS